VSEALALTILTCGLLGYGLAFFQVATLLRWLGHRGKGWPRILIVALVAMMAILVALYGVALANRLGLLPQPARAVISLTIVVVLTVAPWGLVVALERWRRGGGMGPTGRRGIDAAERARRRAIADAERGGIPDDD
jgi:hypothetical protein